MVVACPKCHYSFDVPESELENLDPERAVMVVCPKCGERRRIKKFEKEVARLRAEASKARQDLAKAAKRVAENQRQVVAAHAAAKEARRGEEDAKREDKLIQSSESSVSRGIKQLISSGQSCLIIAWVGGIIGVIVGISMMASNGAKAVGVIASSLVFIATWWVIGHLLRAVAGIWSAVERTASAIEKSQFSKDSQDSA